jgi:hypothetical protein
MMIGAVVVRSGGGVLGVGGAVVRCLKRLCVDIDSCPHCIYVFPSSFYVLRGWPTGFPVSGEVEVNGRS